MKSCFLLHHDMKATHNSFCPWEIVWFLAIFRLAILSGNYNFQVLIDNEPSAKTGSFYVYSFICYCKRVNRSQKRDEQPREIRGQLHELLFRKYRNAMSP